MANISDFATKFNCTIWPYQGRGIYGGPVWGVPIFLEGEIWYKATNEKFKDNKGNELISKYKIITSGDNKAVFNERDYIALDENLVTEPDPIQVGAHEIMSAALIKVPFAGLSSELIVMV